MDTKEEATNKIISVLKNTGVASNSEIEILNMLGDNLRFLGIRNNSFCFHYDTVTGVYSAYLQGGDDYSPEGEGNTPEIALKNLFEDWKEWMEYEKQIYFSLLPKEN